MRRPFRFAFRLLLVAAALAAVPIASAVLGPARTPYLSALSDLSAGTVYAAGCQHKACFFIGGRSKCASTTEATNCKSGTGFCESKPCPV